MQFVATIAEIALMDGLRAARLNCPAAMVPAPGQYLLAHEATSDAPLATVVYSARSLPDGIISAPGVPEQWSPGTLLDIRGPLGHGFTLPSLASRLALVAWDGGPRRLLALLEPAARQHASVSLVCENPPEELPPQIEVLPLHALADVLKWADYIAFDAARESLPALRNQLRAGGKPVSGLQAQVLVRVPMPCGGLAQCGVCSVRARGATALPVRKDPSST